MAKIRRKLTRFETLAVTACGYEESCAKAARCRFELEDFIEAELDRLSQKAGEL